MVLRFAQSPWLPPLGACCAGIASVALVFAFMPGSLETSKQGASVPQTAALTAAHSEFTARLRSDHSNLCLDSDGYGAANGDTPIQQNCGNSSLPRYRFEQVPDTDQFRISRSFDGKCLEAFPAGSANRLAFWNCHQGDAFRPEVADNAQLWQLESLGGNSYRVKSASNGDVLVIVGASYTRGDGLTLRAATGSTDEQWSLDSRADDNTDPATVGQWGPLLSWPFVPVHAAILPDNKLLSWSSHERDSFTQLPYKDSSYTAVYDLDTGVFTEPESPPHDMFCAGTVQMADGRIMAAGGNPQLRQSSIFDPDSGRWQSAEPMSYPRWYGTAVTLADGDVLTTFAKGALETPERYTEGSGWSDVPGASMSTLNAEQNTSNQSWTAPAAQMQWYAFMHAAPDGRVFHAGPTKNMNWFDADGVGSVNSAGVALSKNRQFGSSVMYRPGELLITGGVDPTTASQVSEFGQSLYGTETALTVDINGATPTIEHAADMAHARVNHNAVVMPNGEVLVVGGEAWGYLFNDRFSAFENEIWNPDTKTWRVADRLSSPRNYHSWAMLLQDATVIAGGGGLCGDCGANHPTAQVFTPSYLYAPDGSLLTRPELKSLGSTLYAGENVYVSVPNAPENLQFSMVRFSSVTHSINTDQRWLPVESMEIDDGVFDLALPANPNVLIPGNYWLFAYSESGAPSVGLPVLIESGERSSNSAPILPDLVTVEFDSQAFVDFEINAFEPDGESMLFSVESLPAGLTLDSATGAISGSIDESGTTTSTVSVTDGTHTVSGSLVWVVTSHQKKISQTGAFDGLSVFLLLLISAAARTRSKFNAFNARAALNHLKNRSAH